MDGWDCSMCAQRHQRNKRANNHMRANQQAVNKKAKNSFFLSSRVSAVLNIFCDFALVKIIVTWHSFFVFTLFFLFLSLSSSPNQVGLNQMWKKWKHRHKCCCCNMARVLKSKNSLTFSGKQITRNERVASSREQVDDIYRQMWNAHYTPNVFFTCNWCATNNNKIFDQSNNEKKKRRNKNLVYNINRRCVLFHSAIVGQCLYVNAFRLQTPWQLNVS